MECEYKTGKKSGLECECENCMKIKSMIFNKSTRKNNVHIIREEE